MPKHMPKHAHAPYKIEHGAASISPGPYRVAYPIGCEGHWAAARIESADGHWIAALIVNGKNEERGAAHLALLAAAPRLLDTLKRMRDELDAIPGYWTEGMSTLAQMADEDIKQAEAVNVGV